jgi:ubiquinone biosynthesis protein COQ9
MKSPLAERERDRLIAAMLPDVAFDGWSSHTLRAAARRTGIPVEEAVALFPRGAPDLVAGFSRWADRRMLDRLEGAVLDELRLSARIALALRLRFEAMAAWHEAVRRAAMALAMPFYVPLGLGLLYETVDGIWYAVGDKSTDFSFYTKRASLAGVMTAATLYWLEDRSPGFADTQAFIDRRLADLHRIGGLRERLAAAADRVPNPLRLLLPSR